MSLTVIMGGLGSGKTLLMAYVASKVVDRPVYANYTLKQHPTYESLTPSMLADLDHACLVEIDEAYVWLESRTSGKDLNRFLSYVLFQSRKRQVDIMVTLQLLGSMDIRFRELADYYVVAERTGDGHRYTWIDRYNMTSRVFRMPLEVAQRVYPTYDTMELIHPTDDMGKVLSMADPEEMDESIDKIIAECLKLAPAEDWDKGAVSAKVLELRYPHTYAAHVYNRLKLLVLQQNDGRPKAKKKPIQSTKRGKRNAVKE